MSSTRSSISVAAHQNKKSLFRIVRLIINVAERFFTLTKKAANVSFAFAAESEKNEGAGFGRPVTRGLI